MPPPSTSLRAASTRIVIVPVLFKSYVMLQRNLIYTAITRAKKVCILIGQQRALSYAIGNVTVSKRNTKLKERLSHPGTTASRPVSS